MKGGKYLQTESGSYERKNQESGEWEPVELDDSQQALLESLREKGLAATPAETDERESQGSKAAGDSEPVDATPAHAEDAESTEGDD